LRPETFGAAKVRDAGFSGDAGASEGYDPVGGVDPVVDVLENLIHVEILIGRSGDLVI
jgi:hypothetical protein